MCSQQWGGWYFTHSGLCLEADGRYTWSICAARMRIAWITDTYAQDGTLKQLAACVCCCCCFVCLRRWWATSRVTAAVCEPSGGPARTGGRVQMPPCRPWPHLRCCPRTWSGCSLCCRYGTHQQSVLSAVRLCRGLWNVRQPDNRK